MRRPLLAAVSALAALLTSVALAPDAGATPSPTGLEHRNVPVCARAQEGIASCHAIRRDAVDRNGKPVAQPMATPAGFGPGDIQAAYHLTGLTSAASDTVAIVDAYDAPNAEKDVAVYRSQYRLPACTTANGCFRKTTQTGKGTLPAANAGWAQEISLDLDMVSAACPTCKILLVEAKSASFNDLSAAVQYAATQPGVVAISNSYGGSDLSSSSLAAAYRQPGIAVTASTGDNGYEVQAPASLPDVIAVGGTSLVRDGSTRGWSESAWSGAGSGCSTMNAKPTWQTSPTTCPGKATADVSAVADPRTGVAVYDSYVYQGHSGWMVFGGTSASSPIVASVYALGSTATGRNGTTNPVTKTWATPDGLFDVKTGSNATSCATPEWCSAGVGWDGPTGLGTPNGTTAF